MSKSDLMSMPWPQRLGVLLGAAHEANKYLETQCRETGAVCREALSKCNRWLNGEDIHPTELAWYLDASEEENPWMRESLFSNSPQGLEALIFVTLIIGHVAHYSYVREKQDQHMSESVAEAGEGIVPAILEYGVDFGL